MGAILADGVSFGIWGLTGGNRSPDASWKGISCLYALFNSLAWHMLTCLQCHVFICPQWHMFPCPEYHVFPCPQYHVFPCPQCHVFPWLKTSSFSPGPNQPAQLIKDWNLWNPESRSFFFSKVLCTRHFVTMRKTWSTLRRGRYLFTA